MSRGELPDRFYFQASRTRRLNVVLKEFAKDIALTKASGHREVLGLWREIVGEEIYEHTRVAGLRKGCLSIETDSPALLHHLATFCKEDILRELQTRYKKTFITSIKFKQSTGTD